MKKSAIYKLVQKAVLEYPLTDYSTKLEVLRELMDREDIDKWREDQKEKEDAHEAVQ